MGSRRHGRRRRRSTVQEKLEPSLNFYVTVMKRSDDTEPVQITLDPVLDVESDGDLENGWFMRRFRAMLIRNLQSAGGSTPHPFGLYVEQPVEDERCVDAQPRKR